MQSGQYSCYGLCFLLAEIIWKLLALFCHWFGEAWVVFTVHLVLRVCLKMLLQDSTEADVKDTKRK